MSLADVFISVVAPLSNDASIVGDFVAEVTDVLRREYAHYELVLVDDSSGDETQGRIAELLTRYEGLRFVQLSRPFGEEIAIAAGLDTVIGDFIVVMLPNSDPPSLIPELVSRARSGAGIVFGVRRTRGADSVLTRMAARLFYWYVDRFLTLNLPRNSSQFRVLSRQALNAVVQIRDKFRYLRLLSADVGYATTGVAYDEICRNPHRPERPFIERIYTSVDIIVANSPHPLRFVSLLGVLGGILNVMYTAYVVAVYLLKRDVAPGWTTLSLQTAAMFFVVLLILTVLSEYVGHILVESRDRPLYYIVDERNSPTPIANYERRNIVDDPNREFLHTSGSGNRE